MTRSSYGFDAFVADVRGILSEETSPKAIVTAVEPALARLLASPEAISEDFVKRPDGVHDTGYMLLREEDFNIVSVVWAPGESIPAHNHNTWGVVGVLRNMVEETRYVEQADGSIRQEQVTRHVAGDTSPLLPGDEIHAMHNPTDVDTVEIHVYGKDLVGLQRTMWRTVDHPDSFVSGPYLNC